MSARPGDQATGATVEAVPPLVVDDRSVRVTVFPVGGPGGEAALVVTPPPAPRPGQSPGTDAGREPLVDGVPVAATLERFDDAHAVLVQGKDRDANRTHVLFDPVRPGPNVGVLARAVVVGGWLVEVGIESARRAALRDRARRGANVAGHGGPVEIRAIIPGRVVAVSVAAGDSVAAGQQVLVVEAMKMQNELRAPREGTVARIGVAIGDTIDVGDLLLVIH